MHDIILHHYDEAPFAEKVRLVFGIKGLAWRSVIQPSALPKPDFVPLTGGYRRTPVMQIGADIYCDTQLIIAELEKRHPRPSVFPDGNPGIGYALGSWAHGPYAVTSVAIYMGADDPFAGDVSLPRHFYEDRKKMWMTQFDTDQLKPRLPGYRTRLRAHTDFLRMQLADGRRFMTGDKPGLVDLHAMWDPWFLRRFAPAEARWAYDPYPEIAAWEARLAEVGHGSRSEMAPSDALAVARAAEPAPTSGVEADDPLNLPTGTRVTVTPSDYAEVAVEGTLVETTVQSVSIRRRDGQVGEVVVHFPKIGYDITPL
ncbi:MAG: glutathione S-transferase family protein [Gammaproteobacteria bacterium]